jgi:hypothetical protein
MGLAVARGELRLPSSASIKLTGILSASTRYSPAAVARMAKENIGFATSKAAHRPNPTQLAVDP